MTWKQLRRRYCQGGWWPSDGDVVLFNSTRLANLNDLYALAAAEGVAIPQEIKAAC
ncbi:hypothetical protein ACFY2R_07320 [Micromonospora olivasterospora]|uniref:Uncharacterized protein n=1 Tax=Micromonospora olivasterospora TaxID=1880 RepID=A0A562I3I7_MICOL|nr:hypothetical protein [Micromonospora olivasterospora]TWH65366.1 hypothetical protein JD77_00302 [Micromonospora olivasterospora]